MKNLYPNKHKGKIHPSPTAASSGDGLAVLSLLPAAILALTAGLGFDDKEVLAYLITRSINGPLSLAAEEDRKRRCRRGHPLSVSSSTGAVHAPLFDCGCFECYRSFWIRWDASPDREVIHNVIEAFEEHLASSEKKPVAGGGSGKGARRRERRGSDRTAEKEKGKKKEKAEEKRKKKEAEVAEELVVLVEEAAEARPSTSSTAVVTEAEPVAGGGIEGVDGVEMAPEMVDGPEEEQQLDDRAGGGDRRKSWPDVMGLFNSRFWSLWSPGA